MRFFLEVGMVEMFIYWWLWWWLWW